jgi:protein-tyrosine kinase
MDMSEKPVAPRSGSPLPLKHDSSIGEVLVENRKLSPSDAEAVMRYARENRLRFGDAAIELGLVTRADVQYALARQFDYPYLPQHDESLSRELIAAYAPFSAPVEALRALRTQLMLRWSDSEWPRKTLAIVSAARSDGRSYLAANLAVVFSQQGARSLLVDADLRNPRQHELFRISDSPGLSTLLARRGDETTSIHRIRGLLGLSVLPAGATPPNPLELLTRRDFGEILGKLSAQYDVIIIDTPAAELGADFQGIAAAAESTLLVTRRNNTRVTDARVVAESVAAAGTRTVGAVLNDY